MDTQTTPVSTIPVLTRDEAMDLAATEYARTIAALHMKVEMPSATERWEIAFLMDTVFTRDTWSTGATSPGPRAASSSSRPITTVASLPTRSPTGRARTERPFRLVLDGSAGGEFSEGSNGDELQLDAVEFCRVLSGRGHGEGLPAQEVPF